MTLCRDTNRRIRIHVSRGTFPWSRLPGPPWDRTVCRIIMCGEGIVMAGLLKESGTVREFPDQGTRILNRYLQ
ncbi:hypothetical protein GCM10009755_06270 [Brevibacterium samyangense]|uniref:Uncharacterized protein n=1 Tax=Brevibacterium samyangense TaxID=366888 RepID=A0ABP5EMC1_9MICO